MKRIIDCNYEFSTYWDKGFSGCFSIVCKYLDENGGKLAKLSLEDINFFFETLSGQSVTRLPYDEAAEEPEWLVKDTETRIDLIWGFSGYDYKVITKNFIDESTVSINIGKPVIIKLNDQKSQCFRLVIGYDGDNLLGLYHNDYPNQIFTYDKIEALYIFGEKIMPRYTFLDSLKQMKKILDHNREKDYWTEFINKFFSYFDEKLNEGPASVVKKHFDRAVKAMWHTFNCHCFGSTFDKIKNGDFKDIININNIERYEHAFSLISDACFTTHMEAWIPIEINKLIDWSNRDGRTYENVNSEWALGNGIAEVIKEIDYYDKMLLEAINEMIEIERQ